MPELYSDTKKRVKNWHIWLGTIRADRLDYPTKTNFAGATPVEADPLIQVGKLDPITDAETCIEPAMSQLKVIEPKQYEVVRLDLSDNGLSAQEKADRVGIPARTYREIKRKRAYETIEWLLNRAGCLETT